MILFLVATAVTLSPLQAEAQRVLADRTVDPSAVQFRSVRTIGSTVCGEINEPNRQGGFDGFKTFAYRRQVEWTIARGPAKFVVGTPAGEMVSPDIGTDPYGRRLSASEQIQNLDRFEATSAIAMPLLKVCLTS